jgi:Protein of unknown function (DUF3224)
MTHEIQTTFTVDDWNERPVLEADGTSKVTQATVAKTYTGGVEGSSTTEWLMAYADDGTASFVGLERITGRVGEDDGSVVLRHVGSFEDGAAVAELEVVAGSGTGALTGVRGDGDFRADPAGAVTLRLVSE